MYKRQVNGRELLVAYAPLESTGWSLANVVEAGAVLQALGTLQADVEASTRSLVWARMMPVGGAVLVVITLMGLLFARRLAAPIREMAVAAQKIGAGQWDTPLPPAGGDEIGVLSAALGKMSSQLRDMVRTLEQRVAERTAALSRRSAQLEACLLYTSPSPRD